LWEADPSFDGALRIWPVRRERIGNVRNKGPEVAEIETAAP
jgi:hypothetical protein